MTKTISSSNTSINCNEYDSGKSRSNEALCRDGLRPYPGVAAAAKPFKMLGMMIGTHLLSEFGATVSHWASPEAAQQKSWMEGIDDLQLKMVFYDW